VAPSELTVASAVPVGESVDRKSVVTLVDRDETRESSAKAALAMAAIRSQNPRIPAEISVRVTGRCAGWSPRSAEIAPSGPCSG
jgi:lipoate synthase